MVVEGALDTTVTVSVIGNQVPANPIPESEMDALLLGRTKVSFNYAFTFHTKKNVIIMTRCFQEMLLFCSMYKSN